MLQALLRPIEAGTVPAPNQEPISRTRQTAVSRVPLVLGLRTMYDPLADVVFAALD